MSQEGVFLCAQKKPTLQVSQESMHTQLPVHLSASWRPSQLGMSLKSGWGYHRFNSTISPAAFAWLPQGDPSIHLTNHFSQVNCRIAMTRQRGPCTVSRSWATESRTFSTPNPHNSYTKLVPHLYQIYITPLPTLRCRYAKLLPPLACIHALLCYSYIVPLHISLHAGLVPAFGRSSLITAHCRILGAIATVYSPYC